MSKNTQGTKLSTAKVVEEIYTIIQVAVDKLKVLGNENISTKRGIELFEMLTRNSLYNAASNFTEVLDLNKVSKE